MKKTGVLDQVLTALNGLDVLEFGGIEPNPSYETLMNAVKLAREEKVTFLLAVGGGSVLDAANQTRAERIGAIDGELQRDIAAPPPESHAGSASRCHAN